MRNDTPPGAGIHRIERSHEVPEIATVHFLFEQGGTSGPDPEIDLHIVQEFSNQKGTIGRMFSLDLTFEPGSQATEFEGGVVSVVNTINTTLSGSGTSSDDDVVGLIPEDTFLF